VSVDIVTRLRVLLSKCCIAPAMGVWSRDLCDAADEIEMLRSTVTDCRIGIERLMAERDGARREIERMRRNTGCARNQGTTQFCHEALDAQRDAETLKAELVRNADEFRETLTAHRRTIECLTAERDSTIRELRTVETECSMLRIECGVISAERDEARRIACSAYALRGRDLATERGWDCWKEGEA